MNVISLGRAATISYDNGVDNGGDHVYAGDSMPAKTKPAVYAVSSTQSAAKKIREAGFSHLRSGTVTGIPGILLNEGALAGLDVIVLIVNVVKDMPDFHDTYCTSTIHLTYRP